jgi:Na+-translocating ferredoxin:NAD+ oxidoreductase RnfA subunit
MIDDAKHISEDVTDAVESIESTRSETEAIDDKKLVVRRGLVGSVLIYEITESELEVLEKGSPNSLYFNFLTFFLTTFLSFLIALLTANFDNNTVAQTVFIVISVVSGFSVIVFSCLCLREKNQFKNVLNRIKERIK